MKLPLSLLLCVGLVYAAVWEYGDSRLGTLTWSDSGTIGILEKNKEVHIRTQPCQRVTYVKVEVDNFVSTPEVNFDSITNTVHIRYKLWQSSYSNYGVYVKTTSIAPC